MVGVVVALGVGVRVRVGVKVGVSLGGRGVAVSVGCVGVGSTPSTPLGSAHAVMKNNKQVAMSILPVRLCIVRLLNSVPL
jgi:hypothetical protein